MAKADAVPFALPRKVMIPLVIVVVLVVAVCITLNAMAVHSARKGFTPTLTDEGKLPACESSSNCIVTEDGYASEDVQPLAMLDDMDMNLAVLFRIIKGNEGMETHANDVGVLHVTARSKVWGFVDDIVFRVDEEAGVIHMRLSSRVGKSDFGANRKRYEQIREAWDSLLPK